MSLTKVSFPLIEGSAVSVLDYGADPTGAADSTQAIKDAIAAGFATNNAIYLPAGNYKISSVITLQSSGTPYLTGVKLFGAGPKQSVLQCTGTAFIQSAQDRVNDNIVVSDLSVVNVSSSATIGMDIGTVRLSTFTNVIVNGFLVQWSVSVNRGVANWWNRFFNCEGSGTGSSVSGSIGWALGNDGTPPPIFGLSVITDLDYNDFYGCKSFSVETGIKVYNAIGCVISGHQVTAVENALVMDAGRNNDIQLVAEACTNMGSAAAGTRANTISMYNDGGLATPFVNSGVNAIENQILEESSLANPLKTLDCFTQDRYSTSFTALTKNVFDLLCPSREIAATVTTTTCGYKVGVAEFASVQVWDITRTGGGAITVTAVRTTGTAGVLTATAGVNKVTWALSGDAAAQTIAQSIVQIQGIGVPQVFPFIETLTYVRL
jgi:hypothetical protein